MEYMVGTILGWVAADRFAMTLVHAFGQVEGGGSSLMEVVVNVPDAELVVRWCPEVQVWHAVVEWRPFDLVDCVSGEGHPGPVKEVDGGGGLFIGQGLGVGQSGMPIDRWSAGRCSPGDG